jgi:hypothetical protein
MTGPDTTHALYRFFDEHGALLYVGITNNPGRRWSQHETDKPWWHEVHHVELESKGWLPQTNWALLLYAVEARNGGRGNDPRNDPTHPAKVTCPACGKQSAYVAELDRFSHYDGSDNRPCWLAVSRGATD